MTAMQIVATVTNEGTTAEQVEAVVRRLGKALVVQKVAGGLAVGVSDDGQPLLTVQAVGEAMTFAVRNRHGEIGLWVAAAIAATLGQLVVDSSGQALPPTSATVSQILGRSFSEEGKDLAEKLGLILPRIRSAVNSIKF